jgi:anti-sigma factor RsiW
MCDFSEKLVAWLDRELPETEAAEVQGHIHTCKECASQLRAYREINEAIEGYCDASMDSHTGRERILPGWAPALAAVAACVVLFLLYPHVRGERRVPAPAATASVATVRETPIAVPAAIDTNVHHRPAAKRHGVARPDTQGTPTATWMPAEPAIQIAIPAEAMFAPGAVPQGISFTAELTIAPDGSAEQLRLRP